jgi:hypothetical protein
LKVTQWSVAKLQRHNELVNLVKKKLAYKSNFMFIDDAYPMVAVGDMSQNLGQMNINGPTSESNFQPYKAAKPTGVVHINLIPQINSHSTLAFPALRSKSLVNPGYQEAHQLYNEMRALFANKAYSNVANAEVIVVKVWMMMRVPNRKTAAPVSVIFYGYIIHSNSKLFSIYYSGYLRGSFKHSSPYWCQ